MAFHTETLQWVKTFYRKQYENSSKIYGSLSMHLFSPEAAIGGDYKKIY